MTLVYRACPYHWWVCNRANHHDSCGFFGLRFFEQRDEVGNLPQLARHTGRHRWCNAQRPVNPHEVVDEVLKRHGCGVVLQLAAKAVRQPRVATEVRANRPVLTLNKARADVSWIGVAFYY